jgi:carboxymethylenebutenolidase
MRWTGDQHRQRANEGALSMCFDADSHPPIDPISGGALDQRSVVLQASDGARFRAFEAAPAQPTGAAILILPDVRGLHPYYEELALRFAEHGVTALAIDYFGRTAGADERPAGFDHAPDLAQVSWEGLSADLTAGIEHLRSMDPAPRAIFATGFCMGGRLASLAATFGLGLAGVIPFYGWPVGPHRTGMPAPADLAGQIECAVLAIYGGGDQGISAQIRTDYDEALSRAGVEHRTVVYDGAPHSFFDKKVPEFAGASDAAWEEALAFIRRHTAGQPIAAAR